MQRMSEVEISAALRIQAGNRRERAGMESQHSLEARHRLRRSLSVEHRDAQVVDEEQGVGAQLDGSAEAVARKAQSRGRLLGGRAGPL